MSHYPDAFKKVTDPKWVAAMDRNAERHARDIDERVQRLANDGTKVRAAMFEIFDRCIEDLDYLCNFDHAVDNNGTDVPILSVIEKLRASMCHDFKQLTGWDYVPKILRGRDEAKP